MLEGDRTRIQVYLPTARHNREPADGPCNQGPAPLALAASELSRRGPADAAGVEIRFTRSDGRTCFVSRFPSASIRRTTGATGRSLTPRASHYPASSESPSRSDDHVFRELLVRRGDATPSPRAGDRRRPAPACRDLTSASPRATGFGRVDERLQPSCLQVGGDLQAAGAARPRRLRAVVREAARRPRSPALRDSAPRSSPPSPSGSYRATSRACQLGLGPRRRSEQPRRDVERASASGAASRRLSGRP